MAKYLKYLFKKQGTFLIVLSVMIIAMTFLTSMDTKYIGIEYNNNQVPINNPLSGLGLNLLIFSFVITIYQFRFKMKKLSLNLMYSLPIKRRSLYFAHYLMGVIMLLIFSTLMFIVQMILILTHDHLFEVKYLILGFFALLLMGILVFSFFSFIFTRANNTFDGVVMIIVSLYFFTMVTSSIEILTGTDLEAHLYEIFYPLDFFQKLFSSLGEHESYHVRQNELIAFTITSFISISSIPLMFILNPLDKAENTQGVSYSWFLYRTVIPVFTFAFVLSSDFLALQITILILSYFSIVVFLRSFKRFDWVYLSTGIAFFLALILSNVL